MPRVRRSKFEALALILACGLIGCSSNPLAGDAATAAGLDAAAIVDSGDAIPRSDADAPDAGEGPAGDVGLEDLGGLVEDLGPEPAFEPLLDDTIDCVPGALERVPTGNYTSGTAHQLSARGRYYFFTTTISLDPGDLPSGTRNPSPDVYAWDRRTRQYIWLTRPAPGTPWSPAHHGAELMGRTVDGRYLYVRSSALAPGVGSIVFKDLWRIDLSSGTASRVLPPGTEIERYHRLTRPVSRVENSFALWLSVGAFPGLPDPSAGQTRHVVRQLDTGQLFVVGPDEFGRAVEDLRLPADPKLGGWTATDNLLYEGFGRVRATGERTYAAWVWNTQTGSVSAVLATHSLGYTATDPAVTHDGRIMSYITVRPEADGSRQWFLTVEDRQSGAHTLLEEIGPVPSGITQVLSPRGRYIVFGSQPSLGGRLPTTCLRGCYVTFLVRLGPDASLERLPFGHAPEHQDDGVGPVGWSDDERFLILESSFPLEGWPRDPLQNSHPYVYSVCGE